MKIAEVRASKNTAGNTDKRPSDSSGPSPTYMMKGQDKKCFNIYKAWTEDRFVRNKWVGLTQEDHCFHNEKLQTIN